jgi:signal transduction histidine kinase
MSSDPASPLGAQDDVFIGDSAMACQMRAHDWASTPLGPVAGWAGSLKAALGVLLTSRFEMWLGWGEDIHFFYNDAYRPTLASKHPDALGRPARLVWPEIWDDVKGRMACVYREGASTWDRALLLLLDRRGYLEETYHTFSYSPLRGDAGRVEGLFCAVTEETERVISERRLAMLGRLATHLAGVQSEADVLGAAAQVLSSEPQDLPFTVTYLFDGAGRALVAGMTHVDPDSELGRRAADALERPWDLDSAWREGLATEVPLPVGLGYPTGAWTIAPTRAAIVPIVGQGSQHPLGALVVGLNPYRPRDDDYLSYLGLLAGQLSSSLAGARVHDAERRRAQTLAEAVALREAAAAALSRANESLEQRVALRTAELAEALDKLKHESAEREAAQAALRQAQRMESLGQLTGGVAHDFNNLLQVISGNLQLLRREVVGNELAEKRVQSALRGVTRGAKLASQLLAFGRRQPLAPKVIDIGRFIRGLDDLLRRALGEEIELETAVADGLWNTLVDPGQIENAILNLAINARDAMPEGGVLTMTASNAVLDEAYCRRHHEVQPGQYVALAVGDTGMGIPPELMERVFEPFFSTKPEGKGTGLGLSMVYGLVKQSGGHVKLFSELGEGTTVKIYLPRALGAEDAPADERPAAAGGGSETILVVEDDEGVCETAVGLLADLGYRVLKAGDAMAALSLIESGAAIDLLFTDVVMPGPLRGPELARKARDWLPGLAVLFTSGYTENAIVHGGRLDAGVELLSKPYTREALARKIRHVLVSQVEQRVLTDIECLPAVAGRQGRALAIDARSWQ